MQSCAKSLNKPCAGCDSETSPLPVDENCFDSLTLLNRQRGHLTLKSNLPWQQERTKGASRRRAATVTISTTVQVRFVCTTMMCLNFAGPTTWCYTRGSG